MKTKSGLTLLLILAGFSTYAQSVNIKDLGAAGNGQVLNELRVAVNQQCWKKIFD